MTSKQDEKRKTHSAEFLKKTGDDHLLEEVKKSSGYGKSIGKHGDTIEMYLIFDGSTIERVLTKIDGCVNTKACANAVAHMVEGKSVIEAWDLTAKNVTDHLKTLPPEYSYCAELAVGTLFLAILDINKGRFNSNLMTN